jgi:hypothetical protein
VTRCLGKFDVRPDRLGHFARKVTVQSLHDITILAQTGIVERGHDERKQNAMFMSLADGLERLNHLTGTYQGQIAHRDRHDDLLDVEQAALAQQADRGGVVEEDVIVAVYALHFAGQHLPGKPIVVHAPQFSFRLKQAGVTGDEIEIVPPSDDAGLRFYLSLQQMSQGMGVTHTQVRCQAALGIQVNAQDACPAHGQAGGQVHHRGRLACAPFVI